MFKWLRRVWREWWGPWDKKPQSPPQLHIVKPAIEVVDKIGKLKGFEKAALHARKHRDADDWDNGRGAA